LGEEYGWRNFMIQRLMRFGRTKALIYSGIIWGLWHAPIIVTGHNYGTDYPFFPITGIIMTCIFTTLLGIILTWLRYASKSVWPSALGHAVYNNAAGAFALYYTTNLFIGSVAGLMAFIIMGIIILILQMTGELKKIK
jgi:membrane protease YdiL (CAAX protease family)